MVAAVILFSLPQTFHSPGTALLPVSYARERNNKKQVTALKTSWSRFPEQLRALQHHALSMRKGNLKAHKCSKWMQVMSGEMGVLL